MGDYEFIAGSGGQNNEGSDKEEGMVMSGERNGDLIHQGQCSETRAQFVVD